MLLVTLGSLLIACGDTGTSEAPPPRSLVYCENPDVVDPSCSLPGYTLADDSGLRAKLDGCASTGCHGTGGTAVTTWTLDLSGPSVQSALSPLAEALVTGVNGDYLVDEFDPDCSDMLRKLTTDWGNGQRMPLLPPHWSTEETGCFRSYLHEMSN
jgi:hypothetical protein